MSPIWSRSIAQLRDDFGQGRLSPVEVVTGCLERIAEVNPTLNAHWHVAAAQALQAARSAQKRLRAGAGRPLEGVPVGVKDTIDVAGLPCTMGSNLYKDRVATVDAAVVARLREAGAIILTKDATSEFALGSPYSPLYGFTRNPWHPGYWAGGSSAGGAAGVAAGCLAGAIGTDAGGSVRAPASWSGITGLKPTKGRVSRAGVASVTWTMCTVGTMARTALDAGLLLAAIAGYDPADPQSVAAPAIGRSPTHGLDGVSIGVCWEWAERDADAAEVSALRQAAAVLAQAGARIVELPTPAFSAHVGRIGYHLLHIEAAFALAEQRAAAGLDPALAGRIDQGRFVSADSYLRALRFRVAVQQELASLMHGLDALLLPTTTSTAPQPDGTGLGVSMNVNGRTTSVGGGLSPWTVTFNLAGYPAIAVPSGVGEQGLPLSAQIVAAPFAEDVCVRIAAEFQRLTDHHVAMPAWPPAGQQVLPAAGPPAARPADPAAVPDLAQLGQWFGEPVDEARHDALSASLAQARRDVLALRDLGTESCVGGLLDPQEGDAFLRSYLPRDVP